MENTIAREGPEAIQERWRNITVRQSIARNIVLWRDTGRIKYGVEAKAGRSEPIKKGRFMTVVWILSHREPATPAPTRLSTVQCGSEYEKTI